MTWKLCQIWPEICVKTDPKSVSKLTQNLYQTKTEICVKTDPNSVSKLSKKPNQNSHLTNFQVSLAQKRSGALSPVRPIFPPCLRCLQSVQKKACWWFLWANEWCNNIVTPLWTRTRTVKSSRLFMKFPSFVFLFSCSSKHINLINSFMEWGQGLSNEKMNLNVISQTHYDCWSFV